MWSSEERKTAISGPLIEEMLKADGRSVNAFVTAPFRATEKGWGIARVRDVVLAVADLGKTYAAHRDLLAGYLRQGNGQTRLVAVQNLTRSRTPAEPFVEELVLCATDTSKLLCEAAEVLLRRAPEAARPLLEKAACDANRTVRERAVRLLGRLYAAASRPMLERLRETEKSAAVQEVIANTLKELGVGSAGPAAQSLEPAAAEPIPLHPPVTAAFRSCLQRLFDEFNEVAAKHKAALAASATPKPSDHPRKTWAELDARDLDETCRMLEQGGPLSGAFAKTIAGSNLVWFDAKGTYRAVLEHPDCQLIHAVRFLAMLHAIRSPQEYHMGMDLRVVPSIEVYRRSHTPKITLSHLAEAIRSLGLPDDILASCLLESHFPAFDWEPEAVWPFFEQDGSVGKGI